MDDFDFVMNGGDDDNDRDDDHQRRARQITKELMAKMRTTSVSNSQQESLNPSVRNITSSNQKQSHHQLRTYNDSSSGSSSYHTKEFVSDRSKSFKKNLTNLYAQAPSEPIDQNTLKSLMKQMSLFGKFLF